MEKGKDVLGLCDEIRESEACSDDKSWFFEDRIKKFILRVMCFLWPVTLVDYEK